MSEYHLGFRASVLQYQEDLRYIAKEEKEKKEKKEKKDKDDSS